MPCLACSIGIAMAGVRKANRKDLCVFTLDEGSSVGGGIHARTASAQRRCSCARKHLEANVGVRALVINTGNANAGTGEDGLVRAYSTCVALARKLELAPEQVLPFSTGVIMEPLPDRSHRSRAARGARRPRRPTTGPTRPRPS